MSSKKLYTEKNIHKLIDSGLRKEDRPDEQQKKIVLDLLLHKMEQQNDKTPTLSVGIIWLSLLWIAAVVMVFSGYRNSLYITELIKSAFSLSLFIIPVSSIVIIFKSRRHEKRMA